MAKNDCTFELCALMPAMNISEPVELGSVIFCTATHLSQYRLVPDEASDAIKRIVASAEDAFGSPLWGFGLSICPTERSNAFFNEVIPRITRDVVALCFASAGMMRNCHLKQPMFVYEGDYFDSLPVYFSDHGLIIDRPGHIGVNNRRELRVVLAPYLPQRDSRDFELDETLFAALSNGIDALVHGESQEALRQVFRAIGVAMFGLRIMAEPYSTVNDLLPRIGGWVAAFETLVHPGVGQVGKDEVIELIHKVPWHDRIRTDGQSLSQTVTMADQRGRQYTLNHGSDFYKRMFDVRNKLAHGNAITIQDCRAGAAIDGLRFDQVAILLFRECLLERLKEIGIVERTIVRNDDPASFHRDVGERLDAMSFHEAFAEAVFGEETD